MTSFRLANPTSTGFRQLFLLCCIRDWYRASPVYRATSLYIVPPVVIHTPVNTSVWHYSNDRHVKSICLLNVVIKQGILINTHKTKQATSCRVTCNRVPFITRYCVFIQVMAQHRQFENYLQKTIVYGLPHRDAATYICE